MSDRKRSNSGSSGSAPKRVKFSPNPSSFHHVRSPSPVRGNDDRIHADRFFDNILKKFNLSHKNEQLSFIVVAHIVPTLPFFLRALNKWGNVSVVVPKSSKSNDKVLKENIGSKENPVLIEKILLDEVKDLGKEKKREWFKNEKNIELFLKRDVKAGKFLIIDIGGYFAPLQHYIHEKFNGNFLGIVEDTENGHQKYEEALKKNGDKTCAPIISVARSELKETEDYNVGKSIVEASDAILRKNSHTILERMKIVGVIGFGKIGRSIALHLRQKNLRNIIVYDINPITQAKASSLGFKVVNKTKLLRKSDMIFCATGRLSLSGIDFFILKDNVFISSCTSADDEFNKELFDKIASRDHEKEKESKERNISKYRYSNHYSKKVVNLLHDGDAVNFVFDAVNGPYIYSVQASLILAASYLVNEKVKKDKVVHTLGRTTPYKLGSTDKEKSETSYDSVKDTEHIAQVWLKSFENDQRDSVVDSLNDKMFCSYLYDLFTRSAPISFEMCFDITTKLRAENEKGFFEVFSVILREEYKKDMEELGESEKNAEDQNIYDDIMLDPFKIPVDKSRFLIKQVNLLYDRRLFYLAELIKNMLFGRIAKECRADFLKLSGRIDNSLEKEGPGTREDQSQTILSK